MEIFLDCLPCFLRQVLEASRLATESEDIQHRIMKDAANIVADFESYRFAPELGREIHQLVSRYTDKDDPYYKIKRDSIKTALAIYPRLKRFIYEQEDRLYWALKAAATGNIIDAAISTDIDISNVVENELRKEFVAADLEHFRDRLAEAKNLLIIADNAGETVFDRVLIEELLYLDITYAVRSRPIINDATIKDAHDSGLSRVATLISSGCSAPGVILEECSEQFLNVFHSADIIISKGQGNYETLSEEQEVFFLLKAKCPVIAQRLGIDVNEYVLGRN